MAILPKNGIVGKDAGGATHRGHFTAKWDEQVSDRRDYAHEKTIAAPHR
jgi:hypothetical protein